MQLPIRVAGGHGQGQSADLVSAAVQARTAGEQTVAIAHMDHVFLGAAHRHDGPGAALLPQVQVGLGVERHHPAAGGAAGGLDAHSLFQGHAQQAVGIGVPQIGLGQKGQLGQVLNGPDVLGLYALFVHHPGVVGYMFVNVLDLLDELFILPGDDLVSGRTLDLRLVIMLHRGSPLPGDTRFPAFLWDSLLEL